MGLKSIIEESEKTLDEKLVQEVKKAGGQCFKLTTAHFIGLPDRMCLLPGAKIAFAEMKSSGKGPSPIQKLVHRKIRKLGFVVEVIDSSKKLETFLKNNFSI